MQKKIIVLALAAAFSAPAFAADTTVYGVADAVVANVQASGTKSDTLVMSGGLGGSRLGVKVSEDLGDGMKAAVVLEYGLDVTISDSLPSARQELVSLSGDFGTVAAGYLQTTGYDFSRFDPTSGSLVSPLHNITGKSFMIGNNGSLKRASRALAYITPDMGGLTVALNYSTDAAGATGNLGLTDASVADKSTAYLVSVNYVAGPLAAAIVHASNTAASTAAVAAVAQNLATFTMGSAAVAAKVGAKTTETAIGASYNLEVVKLFATYQINKVDTNSDSNNVMSISAVAPVGPGSVALTYAKATMTSTAAEDDVSGMTAAWLQGLNKTTTFYAAYSRMSQGDATNAYSVANNALSGKVTAGTGSSMIAAGLSKKF